MLKSKRCPILPPPLPESKYEILINSEQCDGCELCLAFCPKDIIEISEDKFNSRMLHYAIVVKPEDCAGCRQCERLCPTVSLYILETDIREGIINE
ncbi:MAG: ferredoxin family protein [Candidatus Thorarchaeota archaeon]